MSIKVERQEHTAEPPPLEEGYWSALLSEGENAEPVHVAHDLHMLRDDEFDQRHAVNHTDHAAENANAIDRDWTEIRHLMENDEAIMLSVVGANRGGLLVEWRSLRGFVPASQLVNFPTVTNVMLRRNALLHYMGQTLSLRVIELNPEQNRLILSERAARVQAGERANILTHLKHGDRVSGHITNLCDFGAFVDLGGLEGLIHISELSWGRVSHPSDLLKRDQQIDVHVLNVDRENGRVALSLKRLHPDPWETVGLRYHIGEIVQGTITNVVDFGAFACIEEGLEGLIHVSELAEGHFLHPRNVVTEGQVVRARILTIDSETRRLGLSLRVAF